MANLGEKEEEVEQKRLDDMQFAFCQLLGKNVFAPLSSPKNILDVGTGSGAWCVEVAHQFPDANVTGLDLSRIQRKDAPANCRFIVGNLLEGLKFESDCFDFVHSRYLMLLFIHVSNQKAGSSFGYKGSVAALPERGLSYLKAWNRMDPVWGI